MTKRLLLSLLLIVTAVLPVAAAPAGPLIGVTVRGEWVQPAVVGLLDQANVAWVRTSASWADIQPTPAVFNWADLDAKVLRAQQAGVTPVVLVWRNPAWAAATSCGPINEAALPAFNDFLFALATRYNGQTMPRLDYFEFYNEPDNRQMAEEWVGGCWGNHGADYARLLARAWAVLHAVNPQAKVLFGGVAAEVIPYNGAPLFNFDLAGGDFVDDVLAYMQTHPGSAYFDMFTFHYFPVFHGHWEAYGPGLAGKAAYYRQRMAAKGISRPLAVSETGRRSDAAQVVDGIAGSHEEQSRYVVRLFMQAITADVHLATWFTLGDLVQPGSAAVQHWGLLDSANQPKPSYTAMRTLTAQMATASFRERRRLGNAELYLFDSPGGALAVIWAADAAPQRLVWDAASLPVVDKWGTATLYTDGGAGDEDGRADGAVTLTVRGSPIYAHGPAPHILAAYHFYFPLQGVRFQ